MFWVKLLSSMALVLSIVFTVSKSKGLFCAMLVIILSLPFELLFLILKEWIKYIDVKKIIPF